MWSQVGRAWIEHREGDVDGDLFVIAKHGGYRPLGVVHWRAVAQLADGTVIVIDHLAGDGTHELELNWQCVAPPERDARGATEARYVRSSPAFVSALAPSRERLSGSSKQNTSTATAASAARSPASA